MINKLSKGWKEVKVISVAPISEERVRPFKGNRQYLTTGGLDETQINKLETVSYESRPTRADIAARAGDVIAARMKGTLKVLEIAPELNDLIVSTGFAVFRPTPMILSSYLYFYLRSTWFQTIKDKYAQGSTQKAINNTDLELITIPLPPLPIQERIIQILQKIDEIRYKRRRCSDILISMTTSVFERFFGNLDTADGIWPIRTVDSVLMEKPVNGKSPSNKAEECQANVLTLTAVRGGRLNIEHRKLSSFEVPDVSKFFIRSHDAYVVRGNGNIGLLGRMGLYDGPNEGIVFPDTLIRLRFNNTLVLNEFMAYLWDTQLLRRQIVSKAKTTSGTYKISQKDILSLLFPLPPMELQESFLLTAEKYFEALKNQRFAEDKERALFDTLLSRVFTSELTAEWEAANAEWITSQINLQERLPQLLILALIREQVARAGRKVTQTAILVTALMKYVFLLQMEGKSNSQFYHFIPYHYGPFTKQVYADLEKLQTQDLVRVLGLKTTVAVPGLADGQMPYGLLSGNETESNRIEISLTDKKRADQALDDLPNDLKEDVATILDTYGDLDHNALLKTVYEKYPVYAQKSRLRRLGKTGKKGGLQ